jgi:hypothetical protein
VREARPAIVTALDDMQSDLGRHKAGLSRH